MAESTTFRPPRRKGLIFQFTWVAALSAAAALGLWYAAQAEIGVMFWLYLLPALLAMILAPGFLYRSYALWSATYTLERDGIHLQWGFRSEAIPMDTVQWVHAAEELRYSLPLPWVHWPGAVLGTRRLPDSTPMEFLAAQTNQLVVISTPGRAFAISPADRHNFLYTYTRLVELGSLAPIAPRSVQPRLLPTRLWADRIASFLILAATLASLGLIVWVSLAVPAHPSLALRFTAAGVPLEYVPGMRLFLLPVLNTLIYLADLLLGLFIYRRTEAQIASYLLWGSSLLTAVLFLGATYFILNTGNIL